MFNKIIRYYYSNRDRYIGIPKDLAKKRLLDILKDRSDTKTLLKDYVREVTCILIAYDEQSWQDRCAHDVWDEINEIGKTYSMFCSNDAECLNWLMSFLEREPFRLHVILTAAIAMQYLEGPMSIPNSVKKIVDGLTDKFDNPSGGPVMLAAWNELMMADPVQMENWTVRVLTTGISLHMNLFRGSFPETWNMAAQSQLPNWPLTNFAQSATYWRHEHTLEQQLLFGIKFAQRLAYGHRDGDGPVALTEEY